MQLLQQIVNGLMLGGILAFVAVAFTLTIGMLNFLNFTIPALFMLAGMVTWALSTAGPHLFGFGWHWVYAALAGIAVAILASLLIERFTYRYMKARFGDATEHALPLVSSLGFLIVFEHLAMTLWSSDPQRFELPFKNTSLHIGGLIFGIPHLLSLISAIILVAVLSAVLKKTRLGRALRSIAENPNASTLMGVEVQRIVPVVFVIAGVLSALAGILYAASYGTVTPFMGDAIATDAIAGMVLGGLGNIWGAIAGGLLVGLVKVLAISAFGAEIEKIPVWGLLLLILVVRPQGLFGHTQTGKGKF
ncbi:MAG: branched-chain amino acid ABC transporter permease [Betaproteobacteria bacterium]|nr:branched-chain amino acid ABC transporter permease [Betaproteobacteria bacterium]